MTILFLLFLVVVMCCTELVLKKGSLSIISSRTIVLGSSVLLLVCKKLHLSTVLVYSAVLVNRSTRTSTLCQWEIQIVTDDGVIYCTGANLAILLSRLLHSCCFNIQCHVVRNKV